MKLQSWLAAAALPVLIPCGCGGSKEPAAPSYRVYVSNEGSGDLTVIDPVKMEALATVPSGNARGDKHPSPDGKLMYVALSGSPFAPPGIDESTLPPPDKSADGIGVFDIAQNKMLRKVPGGSDPEQSAVVQGRQDCCTCQRGCGGPELVDPATGQVLKTVPTGRSRRGDVSPDGKRLRTSEDEGTVAVVDVASQSVARGSRSAGGRAGSRSCRTDRGLCKQRERCQREHHRRGKTGGGRADSDRRRQKPMGSPSPRTDDTIREHRPRSRRWRSGHGGDR